jgi:site-specific DNA recombinase
MRLAFAYIRRSSYKQQENNSVEIQKQHIQEFAKRNQLNVPDEFIFIEDVTSAFSKRADQRKQLMELGKKMIEMKVPIVIFYDVSRMDRTGYSFTIDFYRPMLEKLPGLEVYTTKSSEPLNPEDVNVKMDFLLFQYESEIKSERAIGCITSDLEKGLKIRPGSTTPYGYSQIKKKLHPNEDADVVSFIFFLSAWGQSLQKIAFLLNEAKIPSPKGSKWRPSTIDNILKNPIYLGNLTWEVPKRKEGQKHYTFENTHQPIINEFLFNLNQQNKKLQESYGRIDTPFLFLNKIRCRHCHQLLITQNGSTKRNGTNYQYHYYVCKHCQYKVNAQDVHEKLVPLILNHVHQFISSDQAKQQTLEFLQQMEGNVKELVLKTESVIQNLTPKKEMAKKMTDRELELQINSSLQHHQDLLIDYQNCLVNLIKTYKAVESDQYFPRFNDILDCNLGTNEKRLILLYFVDFILLSTDQQPYIQYKTNIFDELASFSMDRLSKQ